MSHTAGRGRLVVGGWLVVLISAAPEIVRLSPTRLACGLALCVPLPTPLR
jgi:hypothetical protein